MSSSRQNSDGSFEPPVTRLGDAPGKNGAATAKSGADLASDPTRALINEDAEDEMTVTGYRLVRWRWLLVWLAILCSCGVLWLFLYWVPRWKLWLTSTRVHLARADAVLIEVGWPSSDRNSVRFRFPVFRFSFGF